ncbi:MAG TPA: hypothetical protein VE758_01225 [Chthoniobacterales bacterium]|nr:hypothetical protein [Chthoniobacterales bacterium]
MRQNADDFRLIVLNPGGRDPEQHFRDGAGGLEQAHPPVNFHGFAACTHGYFHRDVQRAVAEDLPVLLLLRGDFRASERALNDLQNAARKVVVSLKETGLDQIAQQLANPRVLSRFMRLVRRADGCIGTTPEAVEIYRHVRGGQDEEQVAFIPTPYPLEDKRWEFSVLPDKQTGIFIGTREWDVPWRNHFAAVLLARQLCEATGDPVTIVNFDGRKGRRLLEELKFPEGKLRLIEQRKPYVDFLREVAQHKIVLQLDRSRVPGQVAGDALLCRVACVGGNGAIERIAFLRTCGDARNVAEIQSIAQQLLENADSRAALVMESQWRALERVSFSAVRTQLANFFARL